MITPDSRPRTIREVIERHKTLTHEDVMAIPEVQRICVVLGMLTSSLDPADVAIAMALVFGSLAFDAEMQHALQTPEAQERNSVAATFEERLELFGVHARAGYEGVKAFSNKEQVYHEKGTH